MTDDELRKLWDAAMPYVHSRRKMPAKLKALITRNVCNACEQPRREWYMLRNDLWRIVNPVVHGHLCISCLKQRALERLGRPLRRSDFGDQPIDEDGNRLAFRSATANAHITP